MSGQGKNEANPGVGKQTSSPSLRMAPVTGSPTGRLPSFKPPRDLTLGSISRPPVTVPGGRGMKGLPGLQQDPGKKKFVPNLSVQRRDKTSSTSEPAKSAKVDDVKQDLNKKPNQRTRTFTRPELIQTIGSVFSDGMGNDAAIRRRFGGGSGGGGGDGGSAALERPKINLKSLDAKFDRAAEEERLKELLRDDFIDDLTTGSMVPVQLPMIDTGKVFKEEVKKEEEEDEDELRIMRDGKPRVKKSNVILDSDDEEENVNSTGKMDEAKKDTTSKPSKTVIKNVKEDSSKTTKLEFQFSDLVRSHNGDLLFIQLPDHLPGWVAEVKDEKPEPGSSKPTPSNTQCTLESLPEGYFGKLQIRASGRTQLVIGEMTMDVNFGTQVGFLQELVSIDVHPPPQQEHSGQRPSGDISVLGRVRHRLVVTPDWGKLFCSEQSPEPELESSDDEVDLKM